MPTYDYICDSCGLRFDRRQGITEPPLTRCPECAGAVRRLITGGGGFLIKGSGSDRGAGGCTLAQSGRTCCGRSARCDAPGCGEDR